MKTVDIYARVRRAVLVDAYTRECLALEADTSLGSGRVTRVLERLIDERGRPENLRSDNSPEFTSRRMLGWDEQWKVGLVHIQTDRPMQNEHVESFHGRLRDECLNATWFRTLNDVRRTLDLWRQEYNRDRPHNSPIERRGSSPHRRAANGMVFLRASAIGTAFIPARIAGPRAVFWIGSSRSYRPSRSYASKSILGSKRCYTGRRSGGGQ